MKHWTESDVASVCISCSFSTHSPAIFRRHEKRCTVARSTVSEAVDKSAKTAVEQPSEPLVKKHKCRRCNYATDDVDAFTAHRISAHCEHKCRKCDFRCPFPSMLARHYRHMHKLDTNAIAKLMPSDSAKARDLSKKTEKRGGCEMADDSSEKEAQACSSKDSRRALEQESMISQDSVTTIDFDDESATMEELVSAGINLIDSEDTSDAIPALEAGFKLAVTGTVLLSCAAMQGDIEDIITSVETDNLKTASKKMQGKISGASRSTSAKICVPTSIENAQYSASGRHAMDENKLFRKSCMDLSDLITEEIASAIENLAEMHVAEEGALITGTVEKQKVKKTEESEEGTLIAVEKQKVKNTESLLRCTFCNFSNSKKCALERHMFNVHLKMHRCQKCDFSTKNLAQLRQHRATHESKNCFRVCTECAYTSTCRRSFRRHRQKHLNPTKFKCCLCSYSAMMEGVVRRHIVMYHPTAPEDIEEGKCDQNEEVEEETKNGEITGTNCAPSGDKIEEDGDSSDTKRAPSGDELEVNAGGSETKCASSRMKTAQLKSQRPTCERRHRIHACTECLYTSTSGKNFRHHRRQHMNPRKYKCCLCSYSSMVEAVVRRHILEFHPAADDADDDEKVDESETVGEVYEKAERSDPAANLNENKTKKRKIKKLRVTTRHGQIFQRHVKLFRCPKCTFSTRDKSELGVHYAMHGDETKKHACVECAYAAGSKKDFLRHWQQHVNPRKFKCCICSFSSEREGIVRRHIVKYHPDTPDEEKDGFFEVGGNKRKSSEKIDRNGKIAGAPIDENEAEKEKRGDTKNLKRQIQTRMKSSTKIGSLMKGSIKSTSAKFENGVNAKLLNGGIEKLGRGMRTGKQKFAGIMSVRRTLTKTVSSKIKKLLKTSPTHQASPITTTNQISSTRVNKSDDNINDDDSTENDTEKEEVQKLCVQVWKSRAGMMTWTCLKCGAEFARRVEMSKHTLKLHAMPLKNCLIVKKLPLSQKNTTKAKVSDSFVGKRSDDSVASIQGSQNSASKRRFSRISIPRSLKTRTKFDLKAASSSTSTPAMSSVVSKVDSSADVTSPSRVTSPMRMTSPNRVTSSPSVSSSGGEATLPGEVMTFNKLPMKCAHCPFSSFHYSEIRRHLSKAVLNKYPCGFRPNNKKSTSGSTSRRLRLSSTTSPVIASNEAKTIKLDLNSSIEDATGCETLSNHGDLLKNGPILINGHSKALKGAQSRKSILLPPNSINAPDDELMKDGNVVSDRSDLKSSEDSAQLVTKVESEKKGCEKDDDEEPSLEYLMSLMCNHCGYMGTPAEVANHAKIHSSMKSYWCACCKYSTVWKGDLKKHLRRVHGAEVTTLTLQHLLSLGHRPMAPDFSKITNKLANITGQLGFDSGDDASGGSEGVYDKRLGGLSQAAKAMPAAAYIPKGQAEKQSKDSLLLNEEKDLIARIWASEEEEGSCYSSGSVETEKSNFEPSQSIMRCNVLASGAEARKRESEADIKTDADCEVVAAAEEAEKYLGISDSSDERANRTILKATRRLCSSVNPSLAASVSNNEMQNFDASDLVETQNCQDSLSPTSKFKRIPFSRKCDPYKCSACGMRSNWKWNMQKHIAIRHPGAAMIRLDETEARAILLRKRRVCQAMAAEPSKPKRMRLEKVCEALSNIEAVSDIQPNIECTDEVDSECESKIETVASVEESSDDIVDIDPPQSSVVELEQAEPDVVERPVTMEDESSSGLVSERAEKREPVFDESLKFISTADVEQDESLRGWIDQLKLKRFQCSHCSYRTNFRGDLRRHFKVRHDGKICFLLVMAIDSAIATIAQYKYRHRPEDDEMKYEEPKTESELIALGVIGGDDKTTSNGDKPVSNVAISFGSVSSLSGVTKKHSVHYDDVEHSRVKIRLQANDEAKCCDICPYTTEKSGHMKLHMSYHQPQPRNTYRCRYCPYFVRTARLLNHHVLLHLPKDEADAVAVGRFAVPSVVLVATVTTKQKYKYICDHCPYVTVVRNDFWLHRRNHFEKTSTPLKCKLCPYWVNDERLLARHGLLHASMYSPRWWTDPQAPVSDYETSGCLDDSRSGEDCRCVFVETLRCGSMHSSLNCGRVLQCPYCSFKVCSVVLMREHYVFHISITDAASTPLFDAALDVADAYLSVPCRYRPVSESNLLETRVKLQMVARSESSESLPAPDLECEMLVLELPVCDVASVTEASVDGDMPILENYMKIYGNSGEQNGIVSSQVEDVPLDNSPLVKTMPSVSSKCNDEILEVGPDPIILWADDSQSSEVTLDIKIPLYLQTERPLVGDILKQAMLLAELLDPAEVDEVVVSNGNAEIFPEDENCTQFPVSVINGCNSVTTASSLASDVLALCSTANGFQGCEPTVNDTLITFNSSVVLNAHGPRGQTIDFDHENISSLLDRDSEKEIVESCNGELKQDDLKAMEAVECNELCKDMIKDKVVDDSDSLCSGSSSIWSVTPQCLTSAIEESIETNNVMSDGDDFSSENCSENFDSVDQMSFLGALGLLRTLVTTS